LICDKSGICDSSKDIPSTGVNGIAKNYFPYLNGLHKLFSYSIRSDALPGGLTVFDWNGDGDYDHLNIIIDVDSNGYRTWMYSNADCDSDSYLIQIREMNLLSIMYKINNNRSLTNEDYKNVLRVKMANISKSDRYRLANFITINKAKLIDLGFNQSTIDLGIIESINTVSDNLIWSDSILNSY
jgi:hypothetical protein